MKRCLATAVLAAVPFLQACAGGAITDGSGNRITGNGNGDLVVNFKSTSSGTTYTTGVDSNGYFGFDGYAPASATNNRIFVPVGTYDVWVSSKSGGPPQTTPFTVQNTYNNAQCPDHYVQGQTEQCALYQIELLGATTVSAPAPHASSFVGLATTVVPLASGSWCQSVKRGFGVTNVSPRYNDIDFQLASATDVPWGWKVTSGNLNASGTIAAGSHGGSADIAEHFAGPPYYIYPNTTYTVSFYAGGLATSCTPITVSFHTTYDPTPTCVIDHDCPTDPGDGDDGSNQGDCGSGMDCCPNGLCWNADDP